MTDNIGNPLHEGSGTAAKALAETMAVLVMVIQIYRQSQANIRASGILTSIEQANAIAREKERIEAYRKSQWGLALDKGWMRTATLDEVVHVWAAAVPSAIDPMEGEVRAKQAMRVAEERIEQIDPEIIARYREFLDAFGAYTPETIVGAMHQARTAPPAPTSEPPSRAEPLAVIGELGPVPEAWEAGPVIAGTLPRATPAELEAAPPWAMGASGWTEADRRVRQPDDDVDYEDHEGNLAVARSDAVSVDVLLSGGLRERLATAAASVQAEQRRPSFQRTGADIDRGMRDTRRSGAPLGRPIAAGSDLGDDGPALGRER